MQVTCVTVTAAVTVASTTKAYSNVRPSVELSANLDDSDDVEQCSLELQEHANKLCIQQAEQLLKQLTAMEAC